MLDIEEQLYRYGEALEHRLLDREVRVPIAPRAFSRSRLAAAAAAVLVVGIAAAVLSGVLDDDGSQLATHGPSTGSGRDGVFSTTTGVVLLVSDGIDGVTAVDLDHRLAGRRVVEGERAGDQPVRLTLTGGHLVVGWGEIYAAPLSGASSTKIDDGTIYLPAAEPGEVWTVSWDGGRVGQGEASVRRVRVDGTVEFSSDGFDTARLTPLLGVPGGVAVQTPDGVAVWDASTDTVGRILGPGPATAVTSDGRRLAWCQETCAAAQVSDLDHPGPPTAPHVSPGSQQLALSPDGRYLAVLRPSRSEARLIITDLSTGQESMKAESLDEYGALLWASDSQQLFYTENSYIQSSTLIGRYTVSDGRWETHTIPVGDGLAAIAVEPEEARSFFNEILVEEAECPGAGGSYPSGREGTCTFRF